MNHQWRWSINLCKGRIVKDMNRMDHALMILLLLPNLLVPISSGKPDGVCISQGGRFPPFTSVGKPPKSAGKGSKDLNLCRVFRKRTCCDISQTHPALLSIRRLSSSGEASQECLQLWEVLECSICDPRVGIQPGPPLICASFCDKVFQACADAFFSIDAKTHALSPCGANDFVCGRATEWVSNGTELCKVAGFSVKQADHIHFGTDQASSCYGGKASLDSISNSWKSSKSEVSHKDSNVGFLKDFQQWAQDMPTNERVSWAIGGLVLTAGLLFASKRKSRSRRQKLAAIQRTVRRVDGSNANVTANQGSRRGNRR